MEFKVLFIFVVSLLSTKSFTIPNCRTRRQREHHRHLSLVPLTSLSATNTQVGPRTGLLQSFLNFALDSPLWTYVLVPQARNKMVDTASENGIPWKECRNWIESTSKDWEVQDTAHIPNYYKQAFHAYADGNCCWEAAWEQEIASKAVGARNFPAYGRNGETAFRESFDACLEELGASAPKDAIIVDLGCGTGTSTRSIGKRYADAAEIIGIDMSPYFIGMAKRLDELQPKSIEHGGPWINEIVADTRITYEVQKAEDTGMPNDSVDVVNLMFVAHELPNTVTLSILREAHRILKPNGQLWFCEMDFETPGYSKQRANPLLFSLIRATEPYLDEYADHQQEVRDELRSLFQHTRIGAATGRHFAIVAKKKTNDPAQYGNVDENNNILEDLRFDNDGNYLVEDTHLKLWDNKV